MSDPVWKNNQNAIGLTLAFYTLKKHLPEEQFQEIIREQKQYKADF